jgi:hypothetical protein
MEALSEMTPRVSPGNTPHRHARARAAYPPVFEHNLLQTAVPYSALAANMPPRKERPDQLIGPYPTPRSQQGPYPPPAWIATCAEGLARLPPPLSSGLHGGTA